MKKFNFNEASDNDLSPKELLALLNNYVRKNKLILAVKNQKGEMEIFSGKELSLAVNGPSVQIVITKQMK